MKQLGKSILKPPIKWAGGKRQLLGQLEPLFPVRYNLYLEPMLGGGAVFFYLTPARAILIDNNPELINFYQVVQKDLERLMDNLKQHHNSSEYYYHIRSLDSDMLDPVSRASRFLFLNKTGFNGLWRVNKKGHYNVPFGKYKNPIILDEANLIAVNRQLQLTTIILGDFSEALQYAEAGDFIYFDPPYQPLSDTANFTAYTRESFYEKDQKRLALVFGQLDKRGCQVMLSNSDTPLIRKMYQEYDIQEVQARRAINSKGDKRGAVTELVIRNYL